MTTADLQPVKRTSTKLLVLVTAITCAAILVLIGLTVAVSARPKADFSPAQKQEFLEYLQDLNITTAGREESLIADADEYVCLKQPESYWDLQALNKAVYEDLGKQGYTMLESRGIMGGARMRGGLCS